MIRTRVLTIAVFILFSTPLHITSAGTPLISGYISPAPDEVLRSLNHTEPTQPVVGGIKMTYSGYTDYTNNDGFFSFPKHHTNNALRVIICTQTNYDLLKQTVSQIKVTSSSPTIAVYLISKLQEEKKEPVAQPQNTSPSSDALPAQNPEAATPEPIATGCWYFKVERQGTTAPTDGIKPQDLIIHCDPAYVYLHDGGVYYAQENNNFIIPAECMYLLKTPPAADICQSDLMTQSIESNVQKDSIASKSTEQDSMGNQLPGIERTTLTIN